MVLDGTGAEEQLATDLGVRVPVSCQFRDKCFLGGKGIASVGPVGVDVFARSHQLAAGSLGEGVRPEGLEIPVRGAELLACVHPPVPAPQPLPVDQTGAGQVHPDAAAGEPLNGLAVAGVSILVLGYERLGASLNTEAQSVPLARVRSSRRRMASRASSRSSLRAAASISSISAQP